jgi:hypothetical protein
MSSFVLPSYYSEALGGLVAEMAALERLITSFIHSCSSLATWDEIAALIGGDDFKILSQKLVKIVETNLRDEKDLLENIRKITKQLGDLNDQRNLYVHSLWTRSILDPNEIRRRKFVRNFSKTKGLEDDVPVPIVSLKEFTLEIQEVHISLEVLWVENLEIIQSAVVRRIQEYANLINEARKSILP